MIDAMTSAYMGMQQAQLQQEAGTAVLKNSIDLAAQQGSEMAGLIESAGPGASGATDAQIQQGLAMTDPDLAQNVDLLA
ncbi:MAG: YjfB family protein [Alkalispirochaeta sp.]